MFRKKTKVNREQDFFKKLIQYADQNNEPFAAMLADSANGEILAYGINQYPKKPLMHSEITAYSTYNDKIGNINEQAKDLIMYTTACPCPMCTASLPYANIQKVVYGVTRDFLIKFGFDEFTGITSEDILKHAKNANKYEFRQALPEVVSKCEQLFEKYKYKNRFIEKNTSLLQPS